MLSHLGRLPVDPHPSRDPCRCYRGRQIESEMTKCRLACALVLVLLSFADAAPKPLDPESTLIDGDAAKPTEVSEVVKEDVLEVLENEPASAEEAADTSERFIPETTTEAEAQAGEDGSQVNVDSRDDSGDANSDDFSNEEIKDVAASTEEFEEPATPKEKENQDLAFQSDNEEVTTRQQNEASTGEQNEATSLSSEREELATQSSRGIRVTTLHAESTEGEENSSSGLMLAIRGNSESIDAIESEPESTEEPNMGTSTFVNKNATEIEDQSTAGINVMTNSDVAGEEDSSTVSKLPEETTDQVESESPEPEQNLKSPEIIGEDVSNEEETAIVTTEQDEKLSDLMFRTDVVKESTASKDPEISTDKLEEEEVAIFTTTINSVLGSSEPDSELRDSEVTAESESEIPEADISLTKPVTKETAAFNSDDTIDGEIVKDSGSTDLSPEISESALTTAASKTDPSAEKESTTVSEAAETSTELKPLEFRADETSEIASSIPDREEITLASVAEDAATTENKEVTDKEIPNLRESPTDVPDVTGTLGLSTDELTTGSFSKMNIAEKLSLDTTTVSVSSSSADSPETNTDEVKVSLESEKKEETDGLEIRTGDRYLSGNNTNGVAAVQFLHYHDKASSEQCFRLVNAHWNYATNLTEENKKKQLAQTLEYSMFHKEAWKNATSFAWKTFNDTLLKRWFKSLSVLGNAALPEDKLTELNRLKADMKNTYGTAKVCHYKPPTDNGSQPAREGNCTLTLEPDLQRILTKSRDYDELVHVWKAWRDAAGKPIRGKYLRFVELSNEAARLNGFSDTGDLWRESYESETFKEDLDSLWEQLRPLYEHLHAYVRRKLIQQYGAEKIRENGPIPAHLFGNMWAQSWVSLLDITQPFSGKPSVDVTPVMEAKNMSALEMFKISEEFFTSLGLKSMPEEFWKHSIIEKPKDREIICHASAWDFCNGKDYRIKQCTDITMEDLITVHHEMGHIQYFLQYARQPNVFREGANPGFHEAIGDVLALSVSTPKHLKSIGLLEEVADDPEGDLNFLLRTALEKVSFLPSGYLIDLWRWGLFSGDIKPEEMNSRWWELRLKYQGICPPVKRTDTDFDPGAKYHVPGNVPYIRYFVSFIIQFQFHKVLCDSAGHTGPLYKCDIYRSKEAGQILSQVMELGSSEHWSEAMKIMTGGSTNKMDAQPIMEYFAPLLNWLEKENANETLGWKSEDATICP